MALYLKFQYYFSATFSTVGERANENYSPTPTLETVGNHENVFPKCQLKMTNQ
jgi:hypothetical protein